MKDSELTIVVCVAGASLQTIGTVLFLTSDWPTLLKVIVLLLPIGLLLGYFTGRRRIGAWRRKRAEDRARRAKPAKLSLADVIERGWFVSFSDDPNPHGEGGNPRYATAIAEVDAVEDGEVALIWRDKGRFPERVPIALLESRQVHCRRTDPKLGEYLVRTGNEGLQFPGPGATVVSNGWSAHRSVPHGPFVRRWTDLDAAHRAEMEEHGDLESYDLTDLPR